MGRTDPDSRREQPIQLEVGPQEQVVRVGPYTVVGVLGRGGMGVVYEVRGPAGEILALKTIESRFLAMSDGQAEGRFRQEIRVLAELRHPNVVRMVDFGVALHPLGYTLAFFVMEKLSGRSLEARMLVEKTIALPDALDITSELINGLCYLDEFSVIHRDIKPANVFLTDDNRVVLMDFGLARAQHFTRLTRTGRVIGTLAFMSPEALRGQPIDGRSDVYAAGVLLFQMLTGQPPFSGVDPTSVVAEIDRGLEWPTLPEALPPEVVQLIEWMLTRDNAARPAARKVRGPLLDMVDRTHGPTVSMPLPQASTSAPLVTRVPSADLPAKDNGSSLDLSLALPARVRRSAALAMGAIASVAAFGLGITVGRSTAEQDIGAPRAAADAAYGAVDKGAIPALPTLDSGAARADRGSATDVAAAAAGPRAKQGTSAEAVATEVDDQAPMGVDGRPATPPTFTSAEEALAYGRRSLEAGQYEAAARALRTAIEYNPAMAAAYRRLGDALLAQRALSDAASSYKVFLTLRPDAPEATVVRKMVTALETEIRGPP